MPLPFMAAGLTAFGGGVLGALGARERQRQHQFVRGEIDKFRSRTEQDISKFQRAGRERIQSQSADIVGMTQRRGHAVSASLARSQSGGTIAGKLTAGVRATGAKTVAAHEARAFPALGEIVATRRQALRQQTLQSLTSLGAEPSVGFGALQGFTQALPGAADLYENINAARKG